MLLDHAADSALGLLPAEGDGVSLAGVDAVRAGKGSTPIA
jgi:hypothetical protein